MRKSARFFRFLCAGLVSLAAGFIFSSEVLAFTWSGNVDGDGTTTLASSHRIRKKHIDEIIQNLNAVYAAKCGTYTPPSFTGVLQFTGGTTALQPAVTPIRAEHIVHLTSAVNQLYGFINNGASCPSITLAPPIAGVTPIRAGYLNELRQCLDTMEASALICPVCGNGTVESPPEQCEPPTAGCSAACQWAVCGNNTVEPPVETCDPPGTATCDATCQSICNLPAVSSASISCTANFGTCGAPYTCTNVFNVTDGVTCCYAGVCGDCSGGSYTYTSPSQTQLCPAAPYTASDSFTATNPCGTTNQTYESKYGASCTDPAANWGLAPQAMPADCGGGGGPVCAAPDGLKNGDETGVDCGGSCPACAIPAPVFKGATISCDNWGDRQCFSEYTCAVRFWVANADTCKASTTLVTPCASGYYTINFGDLVAEGYGGGDNTRCPSREKNKAFDFMGTQYFTVTLTGAGGTTTKTFYPHVCAIDVTASINGEPLTCPGAPNCGDGVCSEGNSFGWGGETQFSCPGECPATCGDGSCVGGESGTTCSRDCCGAWTGGSCAAGGCLPGQREITRTCTGGGITSECVTDQACPQPGTCSDGIQNQNYPGTPSTGEVGIDCGGPCPSCGLGGPCLASSDCDDGTAAADYCNFNNICAVL